MAAMGRNGDPVAGAKLNDFRRGFEPQFRLALDQEYELGLILILPEIRRRGLAPRYDPLDPYRIALRQNLEQFLGQRIGNTVEQAAGFHGGTGSGQAFVSYNSVLRIIGMRASVGPIFRSLNARDGVNRGCADVRHGADRKADSDRHHRGMADRSDLVFAAIQPQGLNARRL